MPGQRVVSLLPSATELVYELGAEKMLFGVTHECVYPAEAASKPRVISAMFDPQHMSSREIDTETRRRIGMGKEIFRIDERALRKARPDLIICQNTCQVCAAHAGQVEAALKILQYEPQIYSMDPHSMREILESVVELADILGAGGRGRRLRVELEERIRRVEARVGDRRRTVLALEWLDPLFTAGHWVPEMIALAGGKNLISGAGEHSRTLGLSEVVDADPDVIVLMPCGFDIDRTVSEYRSTLQRSGRWRYLRAVRDGAVYAVDANSHFSKPGIRTVSGIEILAEIFGSAGAVVPEGCFKKVEP